MDWSSQGRRLEGVRVCVCVCVRQGACVCWSAVLIKESFFVFNCISALWKCGHLLWWELQKVCCFKWPICTPRAKRWIKDTESSIPSPVCICTIRESKVCLGLYAWLKNKKWINVCWKTIHHRITILVVFFYFLFLSLSYFFFSWKMTPNSHP